MNKPYFCYHGLETEIETSIIFAYLDAQNLRFWVIVEGSEMEVDDMGDAAPRLYIEDLVPIPVKVNCLADFFPFDAASQSNAWVKMAVYGEFDSSRKHEFLISLDGNGICLQFTGAFEMQPGSISSVDIKTRLEFVGIVAQTESSEEAVSWLASHFSTQALRSIEISDRRKLAYLTGGSRLIRFQFKTAF